MIRREASVSYFVQKSTQSIQQAFYFGLSREQRFESTCGHCSRWPCDLALEGRANIGERVVSLLEVADVAIWTPILWASRDNLAIGLASRRRVVIMVWLAVDVSDRIDLHAFERSNRI